MHRTKAVGESYTSTAVKRVFFVLITIGAVAQREEVV